MIKINKEKVAMRDEFESYKKLIRNMRIKNYEKDDGEKIKNNFIKGKPSEDN